MTSRAGGDSSDPRPGTAGEGSLLRVLGVAFGLAVLVGNSIGMGIVRTPGEVAQRLPSGPLFMAVWVLGGAYALLGALTMAELAAMRPRSGGIYPHVHDALGPFPGFVAGWTDWIALCGTMAAVAIVLAEYLGPLVPAVVGRETLTALCLVVGLALLQWRGIRIGDVAQQVTSLVKALSLVALAAVALVVSGAPETSGVISAQPALPAGTALAAAVVVALQSAIFTFDGWTGPIYFSEEVHDPGKDLPRAMIGGVLLVLGIYLSLNIAFLRVLSIQEMAGDPFVAATAATRLFGPSGDTILRVLMIVSLVATLNAVQLMTSRVPHAMSRDGLLPAVFRRVNRGGTPVPSLLVNSLLAVGFIMTNTFDTALALLSFFFVANYALAFTALFVLRRRAPEVPRPFRVPVYPWVPGAALAGSLAFLVGQLWGDRANGMIALAILAASWPMYSVIGSRARARRAVARATGSGL